MNFEMVKRFADSTPGWLTDGEGKFLYEAARRCRGRGVIVEIGSWKGKSTILLSGGSLAGSRTRVYAIDPHTGSPEHHASEKKVWTFDEFKANIERAGVDQTVTPLVKTSAEAARGWNQPIELLWIDGAHEYDMVLLDLELWEPHVVDGGVIAFHDSDWEGPQQVLRQHLFRRGRYKDVNFVDFTTWGTKTSAASVMDGVRNVYVGLLQRIYYGVKTMKLPAGPRRLIKALGKAIVGRIK